MAITRNPAGEARAIQLFPNEGQRVVLWDYERMEELEHALIACIGPLVSVEETTREIDWENPTIVAIVSLIVLVPAAVAAWLLIHFGLGWLLEILMHVFVIAAGLIVMLLPPTTTQSPSAQRKQRCAGFGFILLGIGGLLAHLL